MSVLDFIAEIKRQADLLDRALGRDEAAGIPGSQSRINRELRQDANRLEWECALEDALKAGDDSEVDRLFRTPPRMRSRVRWFVDKFSRSGHAIDSYRAAALANAAEQGTYDTLAPRIVALAEAHAQLIGAYKHLGEESYFADVGSDWGAIQLRHRELLFELESYTPASAVPPVPKMPVVQFDGRGNATVRYDGVTYAGVDFEAAKCLQELIEHYPKPHGLTTDDRPQPGRIIKKLPPQIQSIIKTEGRKGRYLAI